MTGLEGKLLGDFRVVRMVGRGGMGVVYEAIQVSLSRRVALKVLPPSSDPTDRSVLRFEREAAAAAHLHHPNIVRVYSVGRERDLRYIAMEFLEGRTLHDILGDLRGLRSADRNLSHLEELARLSQARTREQIPEPRHAPSQTVTEVKSASRTAGGSGAGLKSRAAASLARNYLFGAVRLMADVADALHVAHEAGILHRDVKPQNLILTNDGRLVLTDFGLAKGPADVTLTGSTDLVGTPLYMSPEQLRIGKGPIDRRSDVYSLGATLYELLTLRPPYEGKTTEAIVKCIVQSDPVAPRRLNPRLPRDIETITLKAVERETAKRYPTAKDLADDLRRFLNFEAIQARPQGPWTHFIKRVRRHRVAAIAIASAVLLGIAATGFALKVASIRAREIENVAESARTLGETHFAMNRFDDAIAQFTIAIERTPHRHEYWFFRGWAHLAKKDKGSAARDFEQAMKLSPASPGLFLFHAYAILESEPVRAAAEKERAEQLRLATPEDYYVRGAYAKLVEKDYSLAAQCFGTALELPEAREKPLYRYRALLSLGQTYDGLGLMEKAADKFREARGANPDAPEPSIWLMRYFLERGDLERARECAMDALRHARDPRTEAMCYICLVGVEDALAHRAPDGETRKTHLNAAIEYCNRAIALDPSLEQAHKEKAVVLARLPRADEEQRKLERELRASPRNSNRWFALGCLQLGRQPADVDGAKTAFRNALEIDPDHVLARVRLAYSIAYSGVAGSYRTLPERAELEQGLRYCREVVPLLAEHWREQMVAHAVIAEISFQLWKLIGAQGDADEASRCLADALRHQWIAVKMADSRGDADDRTTNRGDHARFVAPVLESLRGIPSIGG